ncbi:MAG: hypothetical protein KDE58_31090, partial [Caldilineaceae bacterium]|nr:hypothetical protein [Caldilineaceae bacterium]
PVVVDYYDERRFAIAAANKAELGAEIVDLTYRKHYADPAAQPYVDDQIDSSDNQRRAGGVADWAHRAGQGAYFDWVVANAILPPEDERYSDVRRIDRTTVLELGAIAEQYAAIQAQLDDADAGVNPLGLAQDVVLFDLDPARTAEGDTHFEQIYQRSLATLGNTLKLFEYANQMKLAQRAEQNTRRDFVSTIIEEDTALINELIELFGYPYDADIGVNGTYPEGYTGPDIYNYMLLERTDLTDPKKRCTEESCADKIETVLVEVKPMECLGFFVEILTPEANGSICADASEKGINVFTTTHVLTFTYEVDLDLDGGRGRYLPDTWQDSTRKAWGEIQRKLWGVYDSRNEYEQAVTAYDNHVTEMENKVETIKDRYEVLKESNRLRKHNQSSLNDLDFLIFGMKEGAMAFRLVSDALEFSIDAVAEGVPTIFGTSTDAAKPVKGTIKSTGFFLWAVSKVVEASFDSIENIAEYNKETQVREFEIDLFQLEADYELRNLGREMQALIRQERELRLAVFLAADNFDGARLDYDAAVQQGFRKLQELIRLRKRWAGQIAEERYNDMAFRLFQHDALRKYRQQFDLAQQYVYLTAAAYDYETNLAGNDPANGDRFLRQIVGLRSLGELRWTTGPWDVEPIVGSGGLAETLGRMRDNFVVLKGQLGFNNPQYEANRFSLRRELFGLDGTGDNSAWQAALQSYYVADINSDPRVARLAKAPYGAADPQPGLVIP